MLAGVALLGLHVAVAASGAGFGTFAAALVLLGVGWNFLYVGGTTLLTTTYAPAERGRAQATNDMIIFVVGLLSSLAAGAMVERRLAGHEPYAPALAGGRRSGFGLARGPRSHGCCASGRFLMSRAAMLPSWTYRHKGLLSFAPVAAWTPGAVEPCIYCQLRRSVIGLLGLKGLALRRLGRLIEVDEVSSSLRPNRRAAPTRR